MRFEIVQGYQHLRQMRLGASNHNANQDILCNMQIGYLKWDIVISIPMKIVRTILTFMKIYLFNNRKILQKKNLVEFSYIKHELSTILS